MDRNGYLHSLVLLILFVASLVAAFKIVVASGSLLDTTIVQINDHALLIVRRVEHLANRICDFFLLPGLSLPAVNYFRDV